MVTRDSSPPTAGSPTWRLLRRQLDDNFARLPTMLATFPLVGALVSWALRDRVSHRALVAWCLSLVALAVVGLLVGRSYQQRTTLQLRTWGWIRVGSAGLNGALWGGVLATLLYVPGDLPAQTFVILVVGGTGVTAIATSAIYLPALIVFEVANTLPIMLRLALEPDDLHRMTAGLVATFLFVVLGVGRQVHRSLTRAMELEGDNQQLLDDLNAAHAELREVNQDLNRRVIERTEQLEVARAEQEASQRELQRVQRMEAVGRLAGGVAHDFNNVLTGITGFAGLLHDSLSEDDERREDVDEILEAASRAATLTRQLLAFAKGGLAKPRVLSLSDQVAATKRMLGQIVGENVQLIADICDDPCPVLLDPGQLDQLLLNLVVNARDATPAGGTVRIDVSRGLAELPLAGAAAGTAPEIVEYCVLRVADTGKGIDAALIDRIFEPFVTTKGERGTGLGLATCFGIVERAGGRIEVRSEVGQGTQFTVHLPITTRAASVPLPGTAPARAAHPGAVVLLVEDQEAISRMAARALSRRGYSVFEASSGEAALHAFESKKVEPDLVLSDVILPQMTGFELLDALSRQGYRGRSLLMSGYVDESALRGRLVTPDTPLLRKPFSIEQLLDAVAVALGAGHSGITELRPRRDVSS